MTINDLYPPEGVRKKEALSLLRLKSAMETGEILEAPVARCDTDLPLHLYLDGVRGQIPRSECVAPWISGSHRDIAVLSRVGKATCFTVSGISEEAGCQPVALLSRRTAQEKAMDFFLRSLEPGMIRPCRVVRMESYGAFLDIGCGIVALLPLERISVSRISHPGQRFREGQPLPAAVWKIDRDAHRITMTHRELLGSWAENAALFRPGEAVRGIVRGVMRYGSFVELAPNLPALTDTTEGLAPGDAVSVFIKSIRPERMKIKLQLIEKLPFSAEPEPPRYRVSQGRLERWVYSPPTYEREPVETDFTASDP